VINIKEEETRKEGKDAHRRSFCCGGSSSCCGSQNVTRDLGKENGYSKEESKKFPSEKNTSSRVATNKPVDRDF